MWTGRAEGEQSKGPWATPWECLRPSQVVHPLAPGPTDMNDSVLFWAVGNRNKQEVQQDMRNTSHGCLESEHGLLLHLSSMPLGALHIPGNVHTDLWVRQLLGKAGFAPVLKLCSIACSLPARKYQRTSLKSSLVILHFVTDQFQTRSQICDFTAAGSPVFFSYK